VVVRGLGSRDDALFGGRSLSLGEVVGVESSNGDIWRAQVTHCSDRLIGVRGWTILEGRFRERDAITLLLGDGDRLVRAKAQVLAASGSLMRIVRRDTTEGSDRRNAPRLRVALTATLTTHTDPRSGVCEANIIDLSTSGCALRITTPLPIGSPVTLDLTLTHSTIRLAGKVVRTWTTDRPIAPHAGIQFEPMAPPTARLVNRYLADQLRTPTPR